MDIIYTLIPIGILFLIGAVTAFIWAIKNGQYDDLDSPAHRILFDDDALTECRKTPTKAPTAKHKDERTT